MPGANRNTATDDKGAPLLSPSKEIVNAYTREAMITPRTQKMYDIEGGGLNYVRPVDPAPKSTLVTKYGPIVTAVLSVPAMVGSCCWPWSWLWW